MLREQNAPKVGPIKIVHERGPSANGDGLAMLAVPCPLHARRIPIQQCIACPHHERLELDAFGVDSTVMCGFRDSFALDRPPTPTEAIELPSGDVAARRELDDETREDLEIRPERPLRGPPIAGRSGAIRRLLQRVEVIGASAAPVLITGESGTGKELVARKLHEQSPRAERPFVPVNCASLPETLLEAELFGHERGAFTGAARRREGRFKAADGGTIFLDEVGEIPHAAQAKLLRVLQEGTIEPLGTNTPISVDVRVISATHRNLRDRIASGQFREDLYYRLNVLDIAIPPLRERREDVPVLIEHFLQRFVPREMAPKSISPRAWAALTNYGYPGNVRELEHAIQHAVVLARGGEIDVEHLPSDIVGVVVDEARASERAGMRPLAVAVREFEREYILRALALAGGVRSRAAQILGISRKNLWQKMRSREVTRGRREGDASR